MSKRYSIFKGNDITEISASDINNIVGSGSGGDSGSGGGTGGGSDSGSGDLSDYEGDVTDQDIEDIFNNA